MDMLGTLIYENDYEYKLYAVSMRDRATTRISIETYIVSPGGEMSDLITIKKSDIYRKPHWADVFYGLEADFTRDDIDSIKSELITFVKKNTSTDIQDKATPAELYQALNDYIRLWDGKEYTDDGRKTTSVFIKDGYGFMEPHMMEQFVNSHKDMGYKKPDILKLLKIMGRLDNDRNRAYDKLVSINSIKKRLYKIRLDEGDREKEPCGAYGLPAGGTPEGEAAGTE